MSAKSNNCIVQPSLFFHGRCEEALEFYRKSMSVKKLITMFASVTASFAAPTIVEAAQEKPAMPTATPKPTKSGYAAVIAPHPEDFAKLLDQMGAYMRKRYDWSADVKKLTMPVMLIYGDSDMFRPEHIVKFFQLLGGGLKDAGWQREHMSQNRLAILPNLTHYEMGLAPQLVDKRAGTSRWARSKSHRA